MARAPPSSPLVVQRLLKKNSEPHTGARPSVRLCVGPQLARCVHLCFIWDIIMLGGERKILIRAFESTIYTHEDNGSGHNF
jgi:hypothetical protein